MKNEFDRFVDIYKANVPDESHSYREFDCSIYREKAYPQSYEFHDNFLMYETLKAEDYYKNARRHVRKYKKLTH